VMRFMVWEVLLQNRKAAYTLIRDYWRKPELQQIPSTNYRKMENGPGINSKNSVHRFRRIPITMVWLTVMQWLIFVPPSIMKLLHPIMAITSLWMKMENITMIWNPMRR
jgi:ABC-type sugar transport system, periplasmic component